MVLTYNFVSQHIECDTIHKELLETQEFTFIVGRHVITSAKRHSGNQADTLNEWLASELVDSCIPVGVIRKTIRNLQDIFSMIPKWCTDQMVRLQNHYNGSGNHSDRNRILESDKDFAEHHFCLPAECSAHNIDRLNRRDQYGRQQSGKDTDQ